MNTKARTLIIDRVEVSFSQCKFWNLVKWIMWLLTVINNNQTSNNYL